MPDRMTISPETKAEAAAWLARLHADNRDATDEKAFRAWLAAKPGNAVAFEAVTAVWDIVGALGAGYTRDPRSRFVVRRRAVLAGLGTLVAAGGAFTVWDEAYAGVYETDVGEQKHVSLSDGTQVFLDTDTRIRERFSDSLRKVDLDRGRVNFRVRPDPKRPFVVDAAGQRILAQQTSFDVRRDADRVSVVLLQGRATVLADARTRAQRLNLTSGQRLVVTETVDARVDKPNLAPLTAWQTGQAMFESETLSAATAEMNRYSTVRLEVDDPAVARLRISGVYRVGDNESFARSVARLLPVAIEHYPDHLELVRDESRMPEG